MMEDMDRLLWWILIEDVFRQLCAKSMREVKKPCLYKVATRRFTAFCASEC